MAVYLSPVGGVAAQFFNNNGVPLAGGKMYTYAAGTTTPTVTYTSSAGNVANTNPIILDSAGRVSSSGGIWILFSPYKFVLTDSIGNNIGTWDNVFGIGASEAIVEDATGDGTRVSFTLSKAPYSTNTLDIYISGVYQQRNTYSLTGAVIIFTEAPPFSTAIEARYN